MNVFLIRYDIFRCFDWRRKDIEGAFTDTQELPTTHTLVLRPCSLELRGVHSHPVHQPTTTKTNTSQQQHQPQQQQEEVEHHGGETS